MAALLTLDEAKLHCRIDHNDEDALLGALIATATTAVGVVPMMLGGSTFWAPVGITIFAGGIGSLILVVTILPVLYSKIYK